MPPLQMSPNYVAALTLRMALAARVLFMAWPAVAADPTQYAVTLQPTGDDAVDSALHDASGLISLGGAGPISPFSLVLRAQQDAGRLDTVLRGLGYYRPTVRIRIAGKGVDSPDLPDTVAAAPAQPPVPVDIAVERGPLFTIGTVRLEGAVPPDIAAQVPLASGAPATAANVLAARDKLLAMLRDAGHAFAKVDLPPAVLRPADGKLDVVFTVTAGPVVKLGPIALSGLGHVHEDFIRRRLKPRPGDQFSPPALEAARADLAGLGVFSSVRVETADHLDPDGLLPITFTMTERARHAVDVDLSYSTDVGPTITGGWHHRNLFGNGEQLNLTGSFQPGGNAVIKPGFAAAIEFIKPDFMVRDQTLTLGVAAVTRSLTTYDQQAVTQKAILTRTLTHEWSISLGLTGEQETIRQEGVTRGYNLVGVPLQVKYDSTKSLLDPISGYRATLIVTPTYAVGGGSPIFTTAQISGSAYFDFGTNGRSVLAVRALVGEIYGVASAFGLPPDQRFYAGGSGTVRGYRYQSIGPIFPSGHPAGATGISAGSVEFRQRFGQDFGAVAFVDVGQASARGAPFTSDWHAGAGIGLRYYTAVGPIRADVAVPLNPVVHGDAFELYIGIGQAF